MSTQDLARRAAIDDYAVTQGPAGAHLQGLVELASQVCAVPTAVINIIDDRQQHQIAAVGFSAAVCAREDSMCAQVLAQPGHVTVPDARLDPRFAGNPFVTGEIADVRFYASSPLVTPAGVVIGTLCVFDDVVRELSPEDARALDLLATQVVDVLELRRITRELSRSNDQLAAFAGQVSHDLRNPLTALSGFLEMATTSRELARDPDAAFALDRARRSAGRMAALVEDLLEFARIGGRVGVAEVDLEVVTRAVVDDLSAEVSRVGAVVEVGVLPTVRGDVSLLRALLQNLVANALKFSAGHTSQPLVRVVGEQLAGGPLPGGVHVAVEDNGPGVAPGDRERVFGLLERGTDAREDGLGIGLSTCRRIVEAHGGRIGMDASALGGASAWVVLPAR